MSEEELFVENLVGHYGMFPEAVRRQLESQENHCLSHAAQNARPGTAASHTPMFDDKENKGNHKSWYKNVI